MYEFQAGLPRSLTRRRSTIVALLGVVALSVACGGSQDSGPTPVPVEPVKRPVEESPSTLAAGSSSSDATTGTSTETRSEDSGLSSPSEGGGEDRAQREAKSRKITVLKDKIARKQKMLDQKDALRQQYMMLANGSDLGGANALSTGSASWNQLGQTAGNLAGGVAGNANTGGAIAAGIGGLIGILGSQQAQAEAQEQFDSAKAEASAQIRQIDLQILALQNEIDQLEADLDALIDS